MKTKDALAIITFVVIGTLMAEAVIIAIELIVF